MTNYAGEKKRVPHPEKRIRCHSSWLRVCVCVFQKQAMLVRQLEEELRMRSMQNPSLEVRQQVEAIYAENEHLSREVAILRETVKVSTVDPFVSIYPLPPIFPIAFRRDSPRVGSRPPRCGVTTQMEYRSLSSRVPKRWVTTQMEYRSLSS